MPELPEVETICRRIRRDALGAVVKKATIYRPSIIDGATPPESLCDAIAGRRLEDVRRRGKNILLSLAGHSAHQPVMHLWVHLRMTGNLYVMPTVRFPKASIRMALDLDHRRSIVLDDPRGLGRIRLLDEEECRKFLETIGLEPLSGEFTPQRLIKLARSSRRPVKVFLLDQRYLAGLGNIWAAEALYRAGIHPGRPANRLSNRRLTALHVAIVGVLRDALHSAYSRYTGPGGFSEGESTLIRVYGREGQPCSTCGRTVRRMKQDQRSTYFCPGCQR